MAQNEQDSMDATITCYVQHNKTIILRKLIKSFILAITFFIYHKITDF